MSAATQPTAMEATNALERASSSNTLRCTTASANRAFTATHSSTCNATTAAPILTSAGPTRRATMKAEAKERIAEMAASRLAQTMLVTGEGIMGGVHRPCGWRPLPALRADLSRIAGEVYFGWRHRAT